MTEKNKIRGKKSRASGQRFELNVRKDLEEKGWIVDKWTNNVEITKEKTWAVKTKNKDTLVEFCKKYFNEKKDVDNLVINCACGKKYIYKTFKDIPEHSVKCSCGRIVVGYDDDELEPEEIGHGKLISAKRKFNPFSRALSLGTGFPDFIAFTFKEIKIDISELSYKEEIVNGNICTIIGVEAKSNGYLDKEEKEKCEWLLKNKIFRKILIAKKGKKRGEIIYTEYQKV